MFANHGRAGNGPAFLWISNATLQPVSCTGHERIFAGHCRHHVRLITVISGLALSLTGVKVVPIPRLT
jgi:hypothetical protein